MLDDPVTAQYTHTPTVTGRLEGIYTCHVANNKPSSDSMELKVQGIYEQYYLIFIIYSYLSPAQPESITFYPISANGEGSDTSEIMEIT